ncbi:MAG: hypothetical protein AB8B84_03875 [Granulosicoccus sp.]
MSNSQTAGTMSIGWKVYWVLVTATVTNYLIMVLWSLPRVSEMAGGEVPFDMRPGGYSFDEAQVFLTVITDAGRDFYLDTQQYLDIFYPTLFATTAAISLLHLAPTYWGRSLSVLAIAAGLFDHLENSAVAVMLRAGPEAITEAMASTASNWSLAKSISTTIVLVALMIILCIKGIARLRTRKDNVRLN